MTNPGPPSSFDPYDLWMTSLGVFAKKHYYQGRVVGKLISVLIGLVDWLIPNLIRNILALKKRVYPITVAQWILSRENSDESEYMLDLLLSVSSSREKIYGRCWGLGFPWMSKNGLYDEETPFVTHTPYALEALIRIYKESESQEIKDKAYENFEASRKFLDALKVMYEKDDVLALSYAPIDEPRIVINANSYAAFSYALHASYCKLEAQLARRRAALLVNWTISQQQPDGSWYYYADAEPGNFIDGFHTCFVLKNLIKTAQLLPELEEQTKPAVNAGIDYLNKAFIDQKTGLLRRFTERDIKDPFTWDLYDQAEYLGLLIYLGRLSEAERFLKVVYKHFYKRGHWYCRRDFLGRYWGRDFLRWGIMPLLHYEKELALAVQQDIN